MNDMRSSLWVVLKINEDALTGTASLINNGSETLRIWEGGNFWGDYMWSFDLHTPTEKFNYVQKLKVYTRNIPVPKPLKSMESVDYDFDLKDGSWEGETELEVADVISITANFEIQESQEAKELDVWTGRISCDLNL